MQEGEAAAAWQSLHLLLCSLDADYFLQGNDYLPPVHGMRFGDLDEIQPDLDQPCPDRLLVCCAQSHLASSRPVAVAEQNDAVKIMRNK